MPKPNPQNNSYFSQSTPPIRVTSQESNRSAIQDSTPNSEDPSFEQKSSFSQAIREAKSAIGSLNPNAVYGMSEADAIKYTKTSIADLEQKMAKIASLNSFATGQPQQAPPQQRIAANNTQVQNSVSHVTNITSDYLRNIRSEYQKMPQWRTEAG